MHPCDSKEGQKQSLTSSSLPCSSHHSKPFLSEQQTLEEKSAKVKRRRTRRERNYVKFGRNVAGRAPEKQSNGRALQKALPPFWSSQLSRCSKSTPIQGRKGPCVGKPVIITQNRLSQHLGMFNREVKSVNIERLLDLSTEQGIMEVTPAQKDSRSEMPLEDEVPSCKPLDVDLKPIPNEDLGLCVKDPCEMNEDCLQATPVATKMMVEHHLVSDLNAIEAESQLPVTSDLAESGLPTAESDTFRSNATVIPNEKKLSPALADKSEAKEGKSPVKGLAQDLQKLLDLKTVFPGRDLIRETRQAVINALLEQKKTLPGFSALALLRRLAGGCHKDANYAGFKNSSDGEQKKLEQTPSRGSKHSDQEVCMKKQRRSKQVFPTSSSLHSVHVKRAEESPSQREDFRCCADPRAFDPHSQYVAAFQSQSHFPGASSQHLNSARSSLASEQQCPLHKTLFRMDQQGEQGLGRLCRRLRRGQERPPASDRLLAKTTSKGHCLPFKPLDSLGLFSLASDGKGTDHLFSANACQQHPCAHELNSDPWNFLEKEPAPVHNLYPLEDPFSAQPLDLGHKLGDRAASESQTSFDVLKSIWSPKAPRKEAILPVSRGLGCLCPALHPPLSKELTSEQGQPEEFLQLYSIVPQQNSSTYRENPEHLRYLPSRHSQHRSGLFSALSKPRVYSCEGPATQRRTSNNYQFSGLPEATERTQRTLGQGCSRSENQASELERLLQVEGTQRLHFFQQLPMSYFPPSEALEKRNSPFCTLQDHLLGQSSPEPWAFPRMKLY